MPDRTTGREDALDIFHSALKASRVETALERYLSFTDEVMRVDMHDYSLDRYERMLIVSIGKAAGPLATSFLQRAGDRAERFEGIVVGTGKMQSLPRMFRVYQGGHPSPNQSSLDSAVDILRTLQSLTGRDFVIFLVSGGGSAMVEKFLEQGTSLATIVATHKALVESGAPIAAINAVRKHLSAVKGGRFAAAAAPAEQLTIFVSDVPAGELDALSSGPTLPDLSTTEDVYRIAEEYGLIERLPAPVAEQLASRSLAESPKPGDDIFARSRWGVLLDSTSLEEAAAARAAALGWYAEIDHSCDDWSAERAAKYLVERVQAMRRVRERACLISGGEVTVHVPSGVTGKGGRNQHFALLCSELIAKSDVVVLSGGSDGVDGNSPAAGALVDGMTPRRAEAAGYPVLRAIAAFDSYSLLAKLGDTIDTGPTGNNLRDLRILLAP
jgi:hydroxypyruvate reductase